MAGSALLGVLAGFAKAPLPEDTLDTLGGASDAIAHGIERRRSELALAERARELARSNADLEQFAYVASHDLQEPLRIIASYNQLLARRYKDRLDKDANEFIAFTVDGVTRMQRLINDLLAYSRVGTRGNAFGPVSMEKVMTVALQNLRQAVADQGAVVTHDPLPEVTGDEGQLTQLVQNLVANAIKFRGADVPAVHVGARRQEAEWIFEVRDNGVGIEPQYFERIFVIFQPCTRRRATPAPASGSRCARRSSSATADGSGSSPSPARDPSSPSRCLCYKSALKSRGNEMSGRAPSVGLAVLVVEDDDSLRDLLEHALFEAGHRVTTAADGPIAATLTDSTAFDVVVTDIQMPNMDGLSLFRRLRETSPETEVIIMTSHGEISQVVEAMRHGAYDYLAKPFQADDLLVRLERIASHRALRRELEEARAALSNQSPESLIVGHRRRCAGCWRSSTPWLSRTRRR